MKATTAIDSAARLFRIHSCSECPWHKQDPVPSGPGECSADRSLTLGRSLGPPAGCQIRTAGALVLYIP